MFYECFFSDWSDSDPQVGFATRLAETVKTELRWLWVRFFKQTSDSFPGAREFVGKLRNHFLTDRWDRVYTLIEVILTRIKDPEVRDSAIKAANVFLEEENAAYRIVDGTFTDVTSPEEIREITEAVSTKIEPVRAHLQAALRFLGLGEKRDYRNSIKESISAVESLCRISSSAKNFDDGLKALRSKIRIHPALEIAFTKLYGYTSDEGGVRHALLDESQVTGAEARFLLVSCSAFVNYVLASLAERGQSL